jgi:cytochrome c oxidase cbb3-type subunit 3
MTTNKKQSFFRKLIKSLTKAKELGQEDEILTDHNYDGIKELDNVLPPWWLYGFIITVGIAIFYLTKVFIFGAYKQADEYKEQVTQGEAQVELYKKQHPELFKTDVVLLTDAKSLEAGKKIFQTNCIPCHMIDGGGGIGPNLTDNHWILGGGIEKIFHTISEGGRTGKGMIAWKAVLKPKQRQEVASYVISLQGSKPANPKAPQGDIIWPEQ